MPRTLIIIGGAILGVVVVCCIGFAIVAAIGGNSSTSRAAPTKAPVATQAPIRPGPTNPAAVQPDPDVQAATPKPAPGTATPKPAPVPTPLGQLGEEVKSDNWVVIVQDAQRAKEYTWSQFGNKDTAVGEFVIVLLQVKNVGTRNFGLNSFDFELYDGAGTKYNQSTATPGFGEWLKRNGRQPMCSQCPPGVAVDTGVIFDVAPGLPGLQLRIVQARRNVALP